MWKIFIEYADGSKITITGKDKALSLELALKYYDRYLIGRITKRCAYQQYPKNKHEEIDLYDYIEKLEEQEEDDD